MTLSTLAKAVVRLAVLLTAAASVFGDVVQTDLVALTRASSALVGITDPAGDLVRSTDGGATMVVTRSAAGSAMYNLAASGDIVVAVGDGGAVVRSSDGGQTWLALGAAEAPAFNGELRDVAASDALWVAVGRSGFNVVTLWSANAGQNWTMGSMPGVGGTLRGVTYDAGTGRWCAVGSDGFFGARIFTSTDGKNWTEVTAPEAAAPLADVASDAQGHLLAVGESGTVLISEDGGASFVADANSGLVSETLNVVVYASASGWLAAGADLAQISYTAGGGAVVTQEPVPGGGSINALAVSDMGTVITAGALAGFQSITFANPGNQLLGSGSVALVATASSGLPVTFTLVSGPATLAGDVVTFTSVGAVTVRATQAGNASYGPAASVERTFSIENATATVALSGLTAVYDGTAKSVTVTTTPVDLTVAVTYAGNTTAPTDAGTYAVVATITAAGYAGSTSGSLVIAKADQTVTFDGPGDQYFESGTVALSASASSGLPVGFTIDSGPATIAGGTVTFTDAGVVTVSASQAGNVNYNAATTVTRSFTVTRQAAAVSLSGLLQTYDGAPKAVTVTTAPAGLSVDITYDGGSTAPTAAGSYAVVATINDGTHMGTANGTLVIEKATQEITFAPVSSVVFGHAPLTLEATSSSGLTVTLSVVDGPGELAGNILTLTAPGTVTVRASQSGDANVLAAVALDRSIVVNGNFASWQNQHFSASELLNAAVSGPDAVYAADGLANLLKYALGLDPKEPASAPTELATGSDGYEFTFTRPASIQDIAYTVEVSADLTTWDASSVVLEMVGSAGSTQKWRALYPFSSSARATTFFRLKVAQISPGD